MPSLPTDLLPWELMQKMKKKKKKLGIKYGEKLIVGFYMAI